MAGEEHIDSTARERGNGLLARPPAAHMPGALRSVERVMADEDLDDMLADADHLLDDSPRILIADRAALERQRARRVHANDRQLIVRIVRVKIGRDVANISS